MVTFSKMGNLQEKEFHLRKIIIVCYLKNIPLLSQKFTFFTSTVEALFSIVTSIGVILVIKIT